MRIANVGGRAKLLVEEKLAVDVATASGGRFGPALPAVYAEWADFRSWADGFELD